MNLKQKNDINDLKSKLWKMARNLRGNMDAFEFKDYILGLLCFRFLSEKFENFLKEEYQIKDYKDYKKAFYKKSSGPQLSKDLQKNLGFFLKPEELWSYFIDIINKKKDIDFHYNDLKKAFDSIEETSKNTNYRHVFDKLFFSINLENNKIGKTPEKKDKLLSNLMRDIYNICPFNSYCSDILGDVYEYLIGEFAASAGKKAGEFFTPEAVSILMAKIITANKFSLINFKIYDPTCGSGSLLLKVYQEIKNKNKDIDNEQISIYGQELNDTTYNLARMNMLIHNIDYFKINLYSGNTLTDFKKDSREIHRKIHPHRKIVEKEGGFQIIVANPPYSQNWCQTTDEKYFLKQDERFSGYGGLAPKNKADWAFVQHMIYCLKDEGVCAVVLPHGVLFRENSEYSIRKHILDKGYIDAVISLPKKMFYCVNDKFPTCILIIRKCKKDNNVLFIDASQEYTPGKQNTLSETNIDKILKLYLERKKIENLSYIASMEEIQKNNYNLSTNHYIHYISSETKEENINIVEVEKNIIVLETKKKEIEKEINNYLKELRKKENMTQLNNKLLNQPRLRFEEFEEEWKEQSLDNFLKESEEKSTILNQYKNASVTNQGLKIQTNYFNKQIARQNNIGYKIIAPQNIAINPACILINSISFNDKNECFLISPSYNVFKVNPKYNSFFVFTLLKTEKSLKMYKKCINMSSRTILDIQKFQNLKFFLPSLPEQKKIASFLTLLDEKMNLEKDICYQLQKKYYLNNLLI